MGVLVVNNGPALLCRQTIPESSIEYDNGRERTRRDSAPGRAIGEPDRDPIERRSRQASQRVNPALGRNNIRREAEHSGRGDERPSSEQIGRRSQQGLRVAWMNQAEMRVMEPVQRAVAPCERIR